MNTFFDEDSQKIIVGAKKEMVDLRHPYVGSEHLLLAILKKTTLNITKMLNEYGVTYENFRARLIDSVGYGSKENKWFLFTPLLRKVLSQATYESSNNCSVSPYNLLMTLLQIGDGVAIQILLGMNVDLIDLYNKFLNFNCNTLAYNKLSMLDEFGVNMNKYSLTNGYEPVIGREKEIQRLIQVLSRKNKNNTLLIGEAGVGKTAIVEELARMISYDEVPYSLKDKMIYSISIASLVAGTKYRGEFEERLNKIILEVIKNPNVVLFLDEFHTIIGAGGAEGAIDASNILKPYLARGEIRLIGATTSFEYEKYIKSDKAFDRRFQKIYIQEPSKKAIRNILLKLLPVYEKYHSIVFPSKLVDYFLNLSLECLCKGKQPDKTIDFLDEVCSYCVLKKSDSNILFAEYDSKIKNFKIKKEQEIKRNNFKDALSYKNQEMEYRRERAKKQENNNKKTIVTKSDIEDVLYILSKAPKKSFLFKNKRKVAEQLKEMICGQNNVIDSFLDKLCLYDYMKNRKPLSFLFVGKKGVGKTFFVDNVINLLFPTVNFVKINLFDYQTAAVFEKITDTSFGDSGNNGTSLFSSIEENPFSIILVDHVEKGNVYVLKKLFGAFNNGYIMNSRGDKIVLSKCIVFFVTTTLKSSFGFVSNFDKEKLFDYSFDSVLSFNDISRKQFVDFFYEYLKKNRAFSNIEKADVSNIWNKLDYEHYGFYKLGAVLDEEYSISF